MHRHRPIEDLVLAFGEETLLRSGINLAVAKRMANGIGGALERLGAFRNLLSVRSVVAEAQRETGLREWGEGGLMTPLRLLTRPSEDLLRSTFVGKYVVRRRLVSILADRMRILDEIKRHPGILEQKITRPLFVVGMPRSGTTLLQNLLSQDPRCRPLLHWEAAMPIPPPDPQGRDTDSRIGIVDRKIHRLFEIAPRTPAIHFRSATLPAECGMLLMRSLMSRMFMLYGDFREYLSWLSQQDMVPVYEYHKRQLQLLQWRFPPAHWVLKSPIHLRHVDALLTVYPDACVVQPHRDPLKVVPSNLSMIQNRLEICTKRVGSGADIKRAVVRTVDDIRGSLEKGIRDRGSFDSRRFYDVQYRDLVQDPIKVVRGIYEYFDYEYDTLLEERMEKWLRENPKGKHGKHHYSLEGHGLTQEVVKSRFGDYCSQFQISQE